MFSINRRNNEFRKFCDRVGIKYHVTERVIGDALWAEMNRIAKALEGKPAPAGADSVAPLLDRDGLVAAYEAKFGKKPHHAMKDENIQKALEESE